MDAVSPPAPTYPVAPTAPVGAPPLSRFGGRPRWAVFALAPCLVIVAVLLSGFAGVAPWSKAMPFGHPGPNSSTSDLSFGQARTAADTVVAQSSGGPWSAIEAIGIAVSTAVTISKPGESVNYSGPSGCGAVPTNGSSPGSVTLPATTGSLGIGLSAAWILLYTNSTGGSTVVSVLDGVASVLATVGGGPCSTIPGPVSPIAANVIDSTEAASIANSWGGAAFRANFSGAQSVYAISGSMAYTFVPPPCGGGVNCTTYAGYPNGSQGPPPPTVPPIYPGNFSIPSAWSVLFLSCASALSAGACTGPLGSFMASINALNGTVQSVSANIAGLGGFPPGVSIGSSPPVLGGSGSSTPPSGWGPPP